MDSTVLTVLGSGTLLPDARRSSASHHVLHEGNGFLLDCGTGTVHGLARHGVVWQNLAAVVITHFHTDHVGDLPALLAALKFAGRTSPLHLVGPVGFGDFVGRLAAAFGVWILEPGFEVEITELEEGRAWGRDVLGLEVRGHSTPHTDESMAVRIETPDGGSGRVLVGYTGDSGPSESVGRFLRGCSVLVSECALDDPPEMDGHLSPRGVASLAVAARPGLLVLTHVYPPQTSPGAARAVQQAYSGPVVAAEDGLRLMVDGEGRVTRLPVDPSAGPV